MRSNKEEFYKRLTGVESTINLDEFFSVLYASVKSDFSDLILRYYLNEESMTDNILELNERFFDYLVANEDIWKKVVRICID